MSVALLRYDGGAPVSATVATTEIELAVVTWLYGRGLCGFKGLRLFKRECDPAKQARPPRINIMALIGRGLRALIGHSSGKGGKRRAGAAPAALLIAAIGTLVPRLPAETLQTGNLGEVHQVDPIGPMRAFVVLFSDAVGWTPALDDVATELAHEGALVVGVDLPGYLKTLDTHQTSACHNGVGDIESVSRWLQRKRGNASYLTPVVAGVGEGGTLAAVLLAQAPAVTIAGAIAYNPTFSIHTRIPLCSTPAATTQPDGGFAYGPWPTLPGFWVVGFASNGATPARQRVAAQKAAGTPVALVDVAGLSPAAALAALLHPHLSPAAKPPAGRIANLPLVELPAAPRGPLLAIILSGDGGWRDLDKTIAEQLQSDGVSVVGWDSLRYFWSQKSPEQTARDLSAVIDHYVSRWGTSKVALVGYSFGADVLPFAYDHLSPEAKKRVVLLSLLGLATAADFEIRVAGWLGEPPGKDALPTEPALAAIDPTMIQCFYGANEDDTACPFLLQNHKAEVIRTAGGHHFDHDYGALTRRILEGFRQRAG
jgi:type IV secretory pathway VirJ component